ncbi:DUF3098 domain-containing protein [Prevotella koreensis]|uniref:DUF3098 domain-containing protein n=1 Tax=Prevotella koreensis TaxID=2490854 RepID=UPI003FA0CBF8
MDKRNLAFGKMNFILLAAGVAVIIIGFLLMSGSGSTEQAFNPDIFSATRIKIAPVVTFIGFISIIVAIIYKPKEENKKEIGE